MGELESGSRDAARDGVCFEQPAAWGAVMAEHWRARDAAVDGVSNLSLPMRYQPVGVTVAWWVMVRCGRMSASGAGLTKTANIPS